MPVWLIVIVVIVGVLLLLAIGGAIATTRHRSRTEGRFGAGVAQANRALAAALADDRGWEPAGLRAAATRAFSAERPGVEVRGLELVAVHDRPGTDSDEAVFRLMTPEGQAHVTLGRSGGEWVSRGVR